jgi:hypothetical protein
MPVQGLPEVASNELGKVASTLSDASVYWMAIYLQPMEGVTNLSTVALNSLSAEGIDKVIDCRSVSMDELRKIGNDLAGGYIFINCTNDVLGSIVRSEKYRIPNLVVIDPDDIHKEFGNEWKTRMAHFFLAD